MSDPYRVLLIEDCAHDAFFNVRALKSGGMEVQFERVDSAAQLKSALGAKTWDFILSDHCLPVFNSFAALEIFKRNGLDIPFIIVSGLIGEEQAVKLVKAGAHDYVMKDNLSQLVPTVKRELQAAGERRARQRLHDTESFMASIVRDCNDALFGTTLEGSLLTWNKGAQKLYGYTASEILGGPATILESPNQFPSQTEVLKELKSSGSVPNYETVHLRKNGTPVEVLLTVSPIKEAKGRIIGASMLAQDVSRRKQEEDERIGLIQDLADALARTRQTTVQSPPSVR
jgi:two-component system, OmpR family, sensor histidine kinase VicK